MRTSKLIKDTLAQADELAELWTGTTIGGVIQFQKKHLESLVEAGEMNLASVQVLELAQILAEAENEH